MRCIMRGLRSWRAERQRCWRPLSAIRLWWCIASRALTFALAKKLVEYPDELEAKPDLNGNLPVSMVNIIAQRRLVPELLQKNFTAANVASALGPLLTDGPERERQIARAE